MAAHKTAAQQSVDTIEAMLARVNNQKRAEAKTEAGGFAGGSSHPSTDVDDRTEDASEGARSAENTADVKEDQGSSSVDSTSPGTPGGQDSVQMNIGTNQSATGEDPAVETESAKGGKDDPGSSHPARTDNNSLDGQKYASARNVISLIKSAQSQGTQLLAKIAVESDGALKQAATKLQKKKAADKVVDEGGKLPPTTVDDSDSDASKAPPGKGSSKAAAQAGAQLADAAINTAALKQAQDEMVVRSLAETVDVAYRMAEKTAAYLNNYLAEKKAMEEGAEGGDPSQGKSEGSEAEDSQHSEEGSSEEPGSLPGSAPAGDPMAGGGEGGGDSEQALLELLAGGQGMGAGQAAGGMMGGGDPMAGGGMGGGDPMAGGMGGGDPSMVAMGGGGGAGGPPGGGNEQAMLAEALAQAGITPEMFQALLAGKQAAALKRAGARPQRGQWKPKTAEEAQQFRAVLNYVKEVAAP